MSDPTPSDPTRIDDDILSAHLDGELGPGEEEALAAALTRDPALVVRLERLRAAAALAATPVPPLPDDRVDDLIRAALAAGATAPNVTDLARARRRPEGRARWAAAAAVVVLVVLAVPVLRSLGGDGDDETADAGDATTAALATAEGGDDGSADEAADGAGSDIAAAEMADSMEPDDLAPADSFSTTDDDDLAAAGGAAYDTGDDPLPPALGEFADVDGLQAAVEAVLGLGGGAGGDTVEDSGEDGGEEAPASTTSAPAGTAPEPARVEPPCGAEAAERARSLGDPSITGTAVVDVAEAVLAGDPVVVAVIDGTDDRPGMVVVRAADCTVVIARVIG